MPSGKVGNDLGKLVGRDIGLRLVTATDEVCERQSRCNLRPESQQNVRVDAHNRDSYDTLILRIDPVR